MKASLESILDILGAPGAQFLIPVFQRVYAWNRRQCVQLWDDMMGTDALPGDGAPATGAAPRATGAGAPPTERMHFLGTFISMAEDGKTAERPAVAPGNAADAAGAGEAAPLALIDVIDGQQRLTTITLVLVALRDRLRREGDEDGARRIDERYLHTAPGRLKLCLSESDAPTLAHLIDGVDLPAGTEPSKFLVDNLETYRGMVGGADVDAAAVLDGLGSLKVVAVELEEDDSPQQVFESLNAKGRPLSTTDLLRNVLLVKYGADEQERLFEKYWAPIDETFQQFGAEQDIYLDAALHAWAAASATSIRAAKRADLYQAFKDYLAHEHGLSLEAMLKSINEVCLEFAAHPDSPEARIHLDWVVDKPKGMISLRKIFGD